MITSLTLYDYFFDAMFSDDMTCSEWRNSQVILALVLIEFFNKKKRKIKKGKTRKR